MEVELDEDDGITPQQVIITPPKPVEDTEPTHTPHTRDTLESKTPEILRAIANEYNINKRLKNPQKLIEKILEAQANLELVA